MASKLIASFSASLLLIVYERKSRKRTSCLFCNCLFLSSGVEAQADDGHRALGTLYYIVDGLLCAHVVWMDGNFRLNPMLCDVDYFLS